jgi:adenylate kinase family enzyme
MNLEQEQLYQEFERLQSNEKKMIADLQLQRRNRSEDAPEEHSKRIDELEAEKDLLQSELSGLKQQRQVDAEQTV